jgi:hypothetical protein
MRSFLLTKTLFVLSLLLPLTDSQIAMGQIFSPYGYSGWGAYPYVGGSYNTTRNIAAQQQLQGQQIVAERSLALQTNIRNTMENQAQARNQAIMTQKQSDRDWWFQVQQQQVAARQGRPQSAPMISAPVATFEPSAGSTYSTDRPVSLPETDSIIRWPKTLCDARFAEDRAVIEAPYRRTENPPTNPTAAEYRNMLKATEQMKADLLQMTGKITAKQYLDSHQFLTQLAGELQGRLNRLEAPVAPPKKAPEKAAPPEKVTVPENAEEDKQG